MPDPFERHARSNDRSSTWGPIPGRTQAKKAAAEDSATGSVPKRPAGEEGP